MNTIFSNTGPDGRRPSTSPAAGLQRVWLWGGWLAFGFFVFRFMLHRMSLLDAMAFLLTVLAFCLPGWVVLSILWGGERSTRQPELWLWGAALGMAANAWLAAVEGYLTGQARGWSVLSLDIVAITAWFTLWRKKGWAPFTPRPWTFGERVLWQVVTLWILADLSRAFSSFGITTAAGWTSYPQAFAVDLWRQISSATALTLGFPPQSLVLHGVSQPLESGINLLAVTGRTWMDPGGSVTAWVIVSNLFCALGCGGILVTVVRAFVEKLRPYILATFILFFASSFYWIYPLIRPDLVTAAGQGASWTAYVISPLLNWWMLVDPQTLLTVSLGLVSVVWIRGLAHPPSWARLGGFGLVAGIMAGVDQRLGWVGIAVGFVWIISLLYRYPNNRANTAAGAFVFAACAAAMLAPVWWLGIQSPHPLTQLRWNINFRDLLSLPARLTILFGPLLLFGIAGGVHIIRRKENQGHLVFIAAFALALILTLAIQTADNRGFGLHAGWALLFSILIVGLTHTLADGFSWQGKCRWAWIAIIALALPTAIADYFIVGAGPINGRVFLVHSSDNAAADWARLNIPPHAVIQSSPEYRSFVPDDADPYPGFAWAANLALHPMAIGPRRLATAVPDSVYRQRRTLVEGMFAAGRPDSLRVRAMRLGIDYLYTGPTEMQRYPRLRTLLASSRNMFEAVYEHDSAAIYRVLPHRE